MSESGRAASRARRKATSRSHGSCSKASRRSRHMAGRAAGSAGSTGGARAGGEADSGKDVVDMSLLVLGGGEAPGLQVEHGAVAPPGGHQLVMGAELDHP